MCSGGRKSPELALNTILVYIFSNCGSITAFVKPLGAPECLHFLVHPEAMFSDTSWRSGGLGDRSKDMGLL